MDQQQIQKLRELPIEGVAERLGLRVTHGHKCLCPFHDDHHASMSFNLRTNKCRCFVCMGESINTIGLVEKKLGVDFLDACRWLADANNVILEEYRPAAEVRREVAFDASRYERFFLRPWLSEEARRFLFDERRIDARVVRWCRLTSWRDRDGRNWLQTPYYDVDGRLIGVQNRNLCQGATPRFRFPFGSRCGIYNLPVLNLLSPGEDLYITEGCSDCWAMLSAGHKAVAIPSATLLTPKDKELLTTLGSRLSTEFHMYPDSDVPGERLFLQLKEVLPGLVRHPLPAGCKDYGEYYAGGAMPGGEGSDDGVNTEFTE